MPSRHLVCCATSTIAINQIFISLSLFSSASSLYCVHDSANLTLDRKPYALILDVGIFNRINASGSNCNKETHTSKKRKIKCMLFAKIAHVHGREIMRY